MRTAKGSDMVVLAAEEGGVRGRSMTLRSLKGEKVEVYIAVFGIIAVFVEVAERAEI